MQDQTVYYQIVKADDSNYIISLVYSDYSKTLINNLKEQVIDIFMLLFNYWTCFVYLGFIFNKTIETY